MSGADILPLADLGLYNDAAAGIDLLSSQSKSFKVLRAGVENVRQLANELRRIVALADPDETLTPSHLSRDIIASRRTVPVQQSEVVIDLAQLLQEATAQLERVAIERALKAADGNNDDAAKTLGLSRKGLYLRRQRLGLK